MKTLLYLCQCFLFIPVVIFSVFSCTRTVVYLHQEPGTGEYLSGYPLGNTGPYLEEMRQSVKRITSTSYYTTYLFDPADNIQWKDLENIDSEEYLEQYALKKQSSHSTSAGSAIVIHNRNNRVGLVTTYHILASADTLIEYTEPGSDVLKSISVKNNQVNWLIDSPFMGNFEVLVSDSIADIAIIGTQIRSRDIDRPVSELFPVFPYPFGNPGKMKPGNFIYNIGYPKGYPMITTGIISSLNFDRRQTFITNALFNPGFSGGLVVAINGGIPAFEWIGMARSASATRQWYLVPDEERASIHGEYDPYEDEIYLERRAKIDYGITQVISVTRIHRLLEEHAEYFLEKGYNFRYFLSD